MNDHRLAAAIAQQAGNMLADLQSFSAAQPAPDDETLLALRSAALGDEGDAFAQEVLSRLLAAQRPDDVSLSEEAADNRQRLSANRVWIIDPLDGTRQFAMGTPEYAVHVALWERGSSTPGRISAAAVCVPGLGITLATDDDSTAATPEHEGIRLLVSRSRPPRELDALVASLEADTGKLVTTVPIGSVGAKVAHVIGGSADLYVHTSGFSEWDLAAPLAIACHYGLLAADRGGHPIEFNKPDTAVSSVVLGRPELVALAVDALT